MITVLGATGNVGGKVAAQLLAQNKQVRVVGRDAGVLSARFTAADVKAGDIRDVKFLTQALRGSDVAFVMIPPDYAAADFGAHYKEVSESIVQAIKDAKITHVVNLSSLGAELKQGTGPIKHLHAHEERLNRLENVNVLHLRPAAFMENLLMNIPLINAQSLMGSHMAGEVKLPMIATGDIAAAAVIALTRREFTGKSFRELLGAKDLSMNDAAEVISRQIGKTVQYVAFDATSTKQALTGNGIVGGCGRVILRNGGGMEFGIAEARPAERRQYYRDHSRAVCGRL